MKNIYYPYCNLFYNENLKFYSYYCICFVHFWNVIYYLFIYLLTREGFARDLSSCVAKTKQEKHNFNFVRTLKVFWSNIIVVLCCERYQWNWIMEFKLCDFVLEDKHFRMWILYIHLALLYFRQTLAELYFNFNKLNLYDICNNTTCIY